MILFAFQYFTKGNLALLLNFDLPTAGSENVEFFKSTRDR